MAQGRIENWEKPIKESEIEQRNKPPHLVGSLLIGVFLYMFHLFLIFTTGSLILL
jgi:hypothetical protein